MYASSQHRPRWLAIASLLCGLLLVPGCGPSGKPKITLRFWNGFTGPDGRTMLNMVKKFNAENPDVEVVMQRVEWATYFNKLFVAGLGHRAPEVFVVPTYTMERFAQARFLRPVDDFVRTGGDIDPADISPNIWQGAASQGKHWGVPLDCFPMGMYVNRKLFREAGLVNPDGSLQIPRTRDEFLAAAQKMTLEPKEGESKHWGFVFTNQESNTYSLMRQWNGEIFNPDLSRCVLNDPRNVAALQFATDLIRKYKVAPPPENFDAWVGFLQGNVGMAWEGIYMLADLKKKNLDFVGAPVPTLGDRPAVWGGSHNLCLRSDLSGKTLDVARRFVKYLSDNSLDWADGGQVPARISRRNSSRFAAMSVQSAFATQIPYTIYLPKLTFEFEFQTEFDSAVERALRGSQTPQQALDEATQKINDVLERKRREAQTTQLPSPSSHNPHQQEVAAR